MYWGLIIAIILPALFFMYAKKTVYIQAKCGRNNHLLNLQDLFFWCIIAFMYLLLILKSIDIGVDTRTYQRVYQEAKGYFMYGVNWDLLSQPLYYLSLGIPEMLGVPFKTTQAVIYLFCMGSFGYFVSCYAKNRLLPCFFFVTGELLLFYMSGFRQTIAISIGLLAISAAIKKKPYLTILLTIAAIMFHKSAVVLFILILFLYWKPTVKQLFMMFVGGACIAVVVPRSLLEWGANLVGFSQYSEYFGISTNPLLILVYLSIGCFVFMIALKDRTLESSSSQLLLLAIATIGILIIIFSSRFYLLSRLFYYFQLPIYIVLSNCLLKIKSKNNFVLGLAVIVCFVVYFIFAANSDTLQTVPYRFFWEAGETWV